MKKKRIQKIVKVTATVVAALLILATVILPVAAMAEGVTPEVQENPIQPAPASEAPQSPFTWAYLATIAGATAATLLIAQFTKLPLDKVWKIPTRVLVYVIALVLMLLAQSFSGGLSLDSFALTLVNAFIVALAYIIIFVHSVRNAKGSRSAFYSIASVAAGSLLIFQAALNIFGVTDLLPMTGVTLPFVSRGGSSTISCWGLLAFIKAADNRTWAGRKS